VLRDVLAIAPANKLAHVRDEFSDDATCLTTYLPRFAGERTGPGPDSAGPKPRPGCAHRPARSGIKAEPCLLLAPPKCAIDCPKTGVLGGWRSCRRLLPSYR
jgi:hypothetical protein